MNIKIGSRKSALAMAQAKAVAEKLRTAFPSDTFEIVGISTQGDKQLDKSLQSFGGKGVFIKELENALLCGEINMAVHSAKDMPTEMPNGLEISAALLREDRQDVLVYFGDTKIINISVIGTGSARREAQAKKFFPDAVFKPIRGNIHTRLEKVKHGEYDAVIMAKAALNRLNITDAHIYQFPEDFVCAAGQGILAVETADVNMKKYTDAINDDTAMTELTAERAFLSYIGGGCHTPCGASAFSHGSKIMMRTFYGDTKNSITLEMTDTDPIRLGQCAAEKTTAEIKKQSDK
jgi:uroporphyrinogen III methyltransferase/synthase